MVYRLNRIGTATHIDSTLRTVNGKNTPDTDGVLLNAGSLKIVVPNATLKTSVDDVSLSHTDDISYSGNKLFAIGQCLNIRDMPQADTEAIEYSVRGIYRANTPGGLTPFAFAALSTNTAAVNTDTIVADRPHFLPTPNIVRATISGAEQIIASAEGTLSARGGVYEDTYIYIGIGWWTTTTVTLQDAVTQISLRRWTALGDYPKYPDIVR